MVTFKTTTMSSGYIYIMSVRVLPRKRSMQIIFCLVKNYRNTKTVLKQLKLIKLRL